MVLPFFSPLGYVPETAGPQGDEKPSGKGPPSDSDPLNDGESGEKYASLSSQFAAEHRSQIPIPETQSAFIATHNEAPSAVAMRVSKRSRP